MNNTPPNPPDAETPAPATAPAPAPPADAHAAIKPIPIRLRGLYYSGPLTATITTKAPGAANLKGKRVALYDPRARRQFTSEISQALRAPDATPADTEAARLNLEEQLLHVLRRPPTESARVPRLTLASIASIQAEPVRWLWPGKIPMGKLTLFGGQPGIGKSFVAADIAARVSVGGAWPDGSGNAPLGDVILVNLEDDAADTLRPRLADAGADLTRVLHLECVKTKTFAGGWRERGFSLRDVRPLRQALWQCRDPRLIIIDPISAAIGDADAPLGADACRSLTPLIALAVEFQAAVILITPVTQSTSSRSLYRAIGNTAVMTACRAAWLFAAARGDTRRRGMLPLKNNLADDCHGIGYRISEGRVHWERQPLMLCAPDAAEKAMMNANPNLTAPKPYARAAARKWLEDIFASGPISSREIHRRAKEAGIAPITLRRAADSLKIRRQRIPGREGWHWNLPDSSETPQLAGDAQNMSNMINIAHVQFRSVENLLKTRKNQVDPDEIDK